MKKIKRIKLDNKEVATYPQSTIPFRTVYGFDRGSNDPALLPATVEH